MLGGKKVFLRHFLGLLLLLPATGCEESTTKPHVGSANVDNVATTAANALPTGRNRSVVKLTDSAVAKFQEFLGSDPTKHVRLQIKGAGQSGFTYHLQIDDSIDNADLVDKSYGFTFVVDQKSALYVEGTTIDWQQDGKVGFKFDNPNAVKQ